MKNLLIIPARGGSKRIPKKNIKRFKGKPIIEWTINELLKLDSFEKIIVSTDDEEIAKISNNSGIEVPFIRPKRISDDNASTRDVIIHAIRWFKEKNIEFGNVCCVYPTSIFIKHESISNALKILNSKKEEGYIFSATSFPHPIQRSFYINKRGNSQMFFPEKFRSRTQDLENSYHDAGQFYIASPKVWIEKQNIFENGIPFVIPRWHSIDIDTIEDWELSEIIFELNKKNKQN